jgi:hypothetical protein
LTDANERILVNLSGDGKIANLQFVSLEPANQLHVVLMCGSEVFLDTIVSPDPRNGNHLSVNIPMEAPGQQVRAIITAEDGSELIAATTKSK